MYRLLFVLTAFAVSSGLVGCIPVPIHSKKPPDFITQPTLDLLVGESKQSIVHTLGRPDAAYADDASSYFIYGAYGERYDLLFMFYVPFWVEKSKRGELFCILLEFDNRNILRQYQIHQHGTAWSGKNKISDCALSFFSRKEFQALTVEKAEEELEAILENELLDRARQGAREEQGNLYEKYPYERNLVWLCRAADQGMASARDEIGKIYLYGSAKYTNLEYANIAPDLSRACMWFHLTGDVDIYENITERLKTTPVRQKSEPYESVEIERTAKVMTAQQIKEAENLASAWVAGQCDQDLSMELGTEYGANLDLVRLCTEADRGDYASRDELGRMYFFGTRGVGRNLPHAYMWYRLAEQVYIPPSMGVGTLQSHCDAMTPEQRAMAIMLLKNWTPGQCERILPQ